MNLIHDDLHYLIDGLPSDILKIVKDKNLIIAGGYIRAKIAREAVSDIDLFGSSGDVLEAAAKDLALARKGRYFRTKNAFTVLAPPRVPVQFIHRWTFDAPENLVESFDFTIARAAVWWSQDQWHSLVDPKFYPDLAAKRLRYEAPKRNEDAGGSLMRVQKFLSRGYLIAPESLGRVIARLLSGVNDETALWRDGEAARAKVLTGLLRHVDPLTIIDGVELPQSEIEPEPEIAL